MLHNTIPSVGEGQQVEGRHQKVLVGDTDCLVWGNVREASEALEEASQVSGGLTVSNIAWLWICEWIC